MYIVKGNEKTCCTCSHWSGVRAMEDGGFVYSLENLEGICQGIKRIANGTEFDRALTFPGSSCHSWDQWPDLLA
jgi:hypothetical protein